MLRWQCYKKKNVNILATYLKVYIVYNYFDLNKIIFRSVSSLFLDTWAIFSVEISRFTSKHYRLLRILLLCILYFLLYVYVVYFIVFITSKIIISWKAAPVNSWWLQQFGAAAFDVAGVNDVCELCSLRYPLIKCPRFHLHL